MEDNMPDKFLGLDAMEEERLRRSQYDMRQNEESYFQELYDVIELGYASAHVVAYYHYLDFGVKATNKATFGF
jgi:hypothetical protein